MKIVINRCYGGFGLSVLAMTRLKELGFDGSEYELQRDNALLVAVVEELGKKADGHYAQLKVVEIPDGVVWEIDEHIAEKHQVWS